ncbi:hypothetical protein D9M71_313670 [compost metagenome]
MHAGGQRRHRQVPREARDSRAVPGPRRPAAGKAEQPAPVPRRTRPDPVPRQGRTDPGGLPGAAGEGPGPSGLPADPDGDAAFPQPGGVRPGEPRPLRPELRGLHPLHLADPPLSGPAGAPRDPQPGPLQAAVRACPARRRGEHAEGAHLSLRRAAPGAAWRAVLDDRAARRRGDPRRGQLAEVRIHARAGRRDLPRRDHRGDRLRHLRRADRHLCGGSGARHRAAGRLLPLRPGAPPPGR